MPNTVQKYVLLTGSDLGDRNANLEIAANRIEAKIGSILNRSEVIESEPWGFESETRFLNQALLVESDLDPESLLNEILSIEQDMGRQRNSSQWSSRTIDIDILCAGPLIHHSDRLTIPHKHLHERKFALAPLCQLAPEWTHPLFLRTYLQLLNGLEQKMESADIH